MRRASVFVIAAVVLGAATLAGCSPGEGRSAQAAFRPLAVGDTAPSYRVATLQGDSLHLGGPAGWGDVTVMNVWATWCESCREEFADLERISRDYAKRGVRVVAVSVDHGKQGIVERFVREQGTTFTVAHDPEGRVQKLYAAVGVPSTYVVGRDGRIAWMLTGSLHTDPQQLRSEIDKALTH